MVCKGRDVAVVNGSVTAAKGAEDVELGEASDAGGVTRLLEINGSFTMELPECAARTLLKD
jgi:hypothetical protein